MVVAVAMEVAVDVAMDRERRFLRLKQTQWMCTGPRLPHYVTNLVSHRYLHPPEWLMWSPGHFSGGMLRMHSKQVIIH